ncbi:MAG: elongation factor P [Bacteroidetes bacterium]|nr:elongation factor P [Bacteroidota bacterium]
MASTAEIRNGLCIEFNNDYYTVVEFQHVKPGKGAAFVRTKIKSLTTGKVLDNTFPAGHKIDTVRIERHQFQYLYREDDLFHFMNNVTYEQVALPAAMIGNPGLLKEGEIVDVLYHSEKEIPLLCEMQPNTVLEVTYTEPGVKGDTATNTLKPATVETGAEVRVPLFINIGDKVRIDTSTNAYMERVKS